jgi:putative transposase
MKKPFTEVQIIGFLKEAQAGVSVADLCRKHGFSGTPAFTTGEPSSAGWRFRTRSV